MLEQGTKAPDFTLMDQDGTAHTLSAYLDRYLLIYFYPKDDTPGCTKEACAIRDIYKDFESTGVKVFGVSKDTVTSHKKFATKYDLPFTLLADTKREVIEAYGAGKDNGGTMRISYLIDPKRKIAKTYPTVTPTEHGAEILKDVLTLKN
jgi:peroxiredoxin Q/BCP